MHERDARVLRRGSRAVRLRMALAAARGRQAVVHAVLVAVHAGESALEVHVARDGVGRHADLAHRVAGEAVGALRTPHVEHAAALRVKLAQVVNGLLRNLEEVVVGVLGAQTVPRVVQTFVHALHGADPARRRGGAREVLAQHLARPFARVVPALLVAREAVGAERTRHEPALARAGHLLDRARIAAHAAAGEIPAEHLRPLPTGKAEIRGTECPRLPMQGERNRRAHLLVDPEPGLHRDRLRRVVGVQPRAEMRPARHQMHVMALRARLRLRNGLRQRSRRGNLVAVRVQRGEAVDGHRAAAVEMVGRQGKGRRGKGHGGACAQNRGHSPHPVTCLSLGLRLPARSSTRSPRGRRRSGT